MASYISRFNQIFKETDDIYRHAARRAGLPECTFWILYSLRAEKRPLTQHDLVLLAQQPKQTVNTALKKMEADGWIAQTDDPQDRRRKRIRLTAAGLRAAQSTADHTLEAEEAAFAEFAPEEAEMLLHLLHTFNLRLRRQINLTGEKR